MSTNPLAFLILPSLSHFPHHPTECIASFPSKLCPSESPASLLRTTYPTTAGIMAQTNNMGETEKINTNIVTLTRFLTEEQAKHKEATGDFT